MSSLDSKSPLDLLCHTWHGMVAALGWHWAMLLGLGLSTWALHCHLRRSATNPRRLPLPPGPQGIPFFGNMFQLSSQNIWEAYAAWSLEYGDVLYTKILGQGFLVLSSQEAIHDLLDKKGTNFSDRKRTPALQILGFEWNWGLDNYGPELKANRRMFHQCFGPNELTKYWPIIEKQAHGYLKGLFEKPNDFGPLTKYYFGSSTIQMAYGITNKAHIDELISNVDSVLEGFNAVLTPGRYLVDVIPLLRFVPSWFPGAGWKRTITDHASVTERVYHASWEGSEAILRAGTEARYPSAISSMMANFPPEGDPLLTSEKERLKGVLLLAYLAGVDSQASTGVAMILALAKYPEVQKKCQEELDRVIGPLQLPKLSDINSLPYLQAVVKELIRWHTVAPLGIPHLVKDDDEYNGYFIPKGTMVFGNAWALMHNPQIFENPMEFKPERFLVTGLSKPSLPDPYDVAFGYGRRICPGLQLAKTSVTFMAASLMSVYNIAPCKDSAGKELPLEYGVLPFLITTVLSFKCDIKPRSAQHAELIADFEG